MANWKVVLDQNGNSISPGAYRRNWIFTSENYYSVNTKVEVDPWEFFDTFAVLTVGRSSNGHTRWILKSETTRRTHATTPDFLHDMLCRGKLDNSTPLLKISGKFGFAKRGQLVFLRLL